MKSPAELVLGPSLMLFVLLFLPVGGALAVQPLATESGEPSVNYAAEASRIRHKFDANYVRLSSKSQNQYAVRMYRFTGEDYYAQQAGLEVFQITDRLNYFYQHIDSAEWRSRKAQQIIDSLSDSRRAQLRKAALRGTGDKRFAMYLIYQMAKLQEYGLQHAGHDRFVEYLRQADLRAFLLSPQFIHVYAAQIANYIYWLRYLGIVDWTADLRPAFEAAYPDGQDDTLDTLAFNNKLYGLTHIVLADSNYYQKTVSAQQHQWILDYFSRVEAKIVTQSKADVQAEVGLCFLLTGQLSHPTLEVMRELISEAVDPTKDMVLAVDGSDALNSGKHRNVLAYALLDWPDTLHPGPKLLERKSWRANLPMVYQQ